MEKKCWLNREFPQTLQMLKMGHCTVSVNHDGADEVFRGTPRDTQQIVEVRTLKLVCFVCDGNGEQKKRIYNAEGSNKIKAYG